MKSSLTEENEIKSLGLRGVIAMSGKRFRLYADLNAGINHKINIGSMQTTILVLEMKLIFLDVSNRISFFIGYPMLKHNKDKANPDRFKYLYSGAKRIDKDGYNSLKYKPVKIVPKRLFTWILVDLPHLTL